MNQTKRILTLAMLGMFFLKGCVELKVPIALFSALPQFGDASLTVQFTDYSWPGDNEIVSWFWDFGDGQTSDKQHPEHIYQESGKYSVSLTVANEAGLKDAYIRDNYIFVFDAVKLDKISGLRFDPYINNQDPNAGDTASPEQIKERLGIIKPYTDHISIYFSEYSAILAKEWGLKVTMTIWLDSNLESNQESIDWAVKLAQDGYIDILVVGKEVLSQDSLKENQLLDDIIEVKAAVPDGVMVTYIDTYGILADHPNVIEACDIIYANIYPYWEASPIERAQENLARNYDLLKKAAEGKEVVIAETGWPDKGNTIGQAVPSLDNSCQYFKEVSQWAEENNVQCFFTAFDQRYREDYEGVQGSHWGIWNSQGVLKPCMSDLKED